MTPLSESLPLLPVCVCGNYRCTIPYGLCHCGCGKNTVVANKTNTESGIVKGYPKKYLFQHHRIIKSSSENAAPFKIDGVYCRLISLTKGQYAIVDEADYNWLSKWKWNAHYSKETNCYYATRTTREHEGGRYTLSMQRAISGLRRSDGREVDHANHNTLDNRRDNLRNTEKSPNQWNGNKRKDNTSGHKGVSWQSRNNKWRVQICVYGKVMHVGLYNDVQVAHQAYCDAAKHYFGEFAKVK